MRLLRFALPVFQHDSPIEPCAMQFGDVKVTLTRGTPEVDREQSFLATAAVTLTERPQKDDAARLVVPRAERERCEQAIEALVDLIAVFRGCRRSIFCPAPSLALEFETPDEATFLKESRGILALHKVESGVRPQIPLETHVIGSMTDRLSGIALLAEAYACGEAGKFREFARLFELAFRLPFTQIDKKLTTFLGSTPFGYTRDEIREWTSLRHPLAHADLAKTQAIAVTADLRGHIMRMEQAALDVLCNKTQWADRSTTRRTVWFPDAFTNSADGNLVVKQDTKLSMLFRVYDEFGIYPRKLGAELSKLHDSWYFTMNDDNVPKVPGAPIRPTR